MREHPVPWSISRWLVAVFAAAATLMAKPAAATGPTTIVGLGPLFLYHTISEGLANAFSASKLVIMPGVYQECVEVSGLIFLDIIAKKGVVLDATGCDVGLTIHNTTGVTVKNLTIIGAKRGIVVQPTANDVRVTKTTVQDPASDPQLAVLETGVDILAAADVTLDGVTIRGAKSRAVRVASAPRATIRKSTLADGAGAGVVVDLGTSATIAKNTITNLGSFGVVFAHAGGGGATDSLIQANKIFAVPGGIQVAGANNVIEKNKLTDVSTLGILAGGTPSAFSTYRKNTIVRAGDAAIVAPGVGDVFEKNTVKEPLGDGIDVIGDDNLFLGNKVAAAAGTGVLVEATAAGNSFQGTSSSKAGGDGFRVDGTGNVFVKAKASGSGGLDLNDPAGAATTNAYSDCKFKTSTVP